MERCRLLAQKWLQRSATGCSTCCQAEKVRPLSANACMICDRVRVTTPLRRSFFSEHPGSVRAPAWQRDCSYPDKPAQTCVLPRLLRRRLFRNPNRFTESVPMGTLLLQTAVASIHSGLGAKSERIQDFEDNWENCRWPCSISLQ